MLYVTVSKKAWKDRESRTNSGYRLKKRQIFIVIIGEWLAKIKLPYQASINNLRNRSVCMKNNIMNVDKASQIYKDLGIWDSVLSVYETI